MKKKKKKREYQEVLVDSELPRTCHINYIKSKISRGQAILTRPSHLVSKTTLHILYVTFDQPNVNYGVTVRESTPTSGHKSVYISIK